MSADRKAIVEKKARVNRAVEALKKALGHYEEEHPHWKIEVLVSLIRWSIRSLQHYIDNPRDREISWEQPFVELRYPVEWDWQASRAHGDEHGRILYGDITDADVADKRLAVKTVARIMASVLNACTLGELTNWARFAKRGDRQPAFLPLDLAKALGSIRSKHRKQEAYEAIVRPFSVGAALVDCGSMEMRDGEPVSPEVVRQLKKLPDAIDIPNIGFSGDVNGRKIELSLIFQVHPLITDHVEKKAYYPISVGLHIVPQVLGDGVVCENPAEWPRKDRKEFWQELFKALDRLTDRLIPRKESEDSVVITVNAQLKVPASRWKPESRGDTMKAITDALSAGGDLTEFQMRTDGAGEPERDGRCPTCGCTHDRGFTQVIVPGHAPVTIAGVLPDIVRCVHAAHEKGFLRLSTKDDDLLRTCGGYSHPSKAFYDLGQREAYRVIFDTSRRGFIALRGFVSRS